MNHIRIPGDEYHTYALNWLKWTAFCLGLGALATWCNPVLFIPLYLAYALRAGWLTRQASAELRHGHSTTLLLMAAAWVPGLNVLPFVAFAWGSRHARTISSVDRRAKFLSA